MLKPFCRLVFCKKQWPSKSRISFCRPNMRAEQNTHQAFCRPMMAHVIWSLCIPLQGLNTSAGHSNNWMQRHCASHLLAQTSNILLANMPIPPGCLAQCGVHGCTFNMEAPAWEPYRKGYGNLLCTQPPAPGIVDLSWRYVKSVIDFHGRLWRRMIKHSWMFGMFSIAFWQLSCSVHLGWRDLYGKTSQVSSPLLLGQVSWQSM